MRAVLARGSAFLFSEAGPWRLGKLFLCMTWQVSILGAVRAKVPTGSPAIDFWGG